MSENWPSLLPIAFWLLLTIIPSIKLLRRTGLSVGLAALNLLPLIGTIVLIWIVGYSEWPKTQET